MAELFLWSIPFLVIPLSYVFYRYVPFRRFRFSLYGLIFLGALLMNLMNLSFQNDLVDTVEVLLVQFVLWEFFWFLSRVIRGGVFLVPLCIALSLHGFGHKRWIEAGPENGAKLWSSRTASVYDQGSVRYFVKEADCFSRREPARRLTLSRSVGLPFVEKKVGSCRTPEGYYLENFIYKWGDTERGVRLDISHYKHTLWTLGEGF